MRKIASVLFIFIVILVSSTACAVSEYAAFIGTAEQEELLALLESDDFERQIEVLPQVLEPENFERLFPSGKHSIEDLNEAHDGILLTYLTALLETDADDTLRDEVVDIFRSLRHRQSWSHFTDLFIFNPHYREKLEIIIPEMIRAYEEIAEEKFWVRHMLASRIWGLLLIDEQYDALEWFGREIDEFLVESMLVAFDYEQRIFEGEITLDDVSERYKYQVGRLIEGRREEGGFDLDFSW